MNDIEQGKENFQKAFLEVCKDYLENLELAPEEDVFISPKLQRKMNRLLKEQQKPYWKLINTPLKKVIAACLAISIIFGSLLGFKNIREPIFEFFADVYEKFTEFFFEAEKQEDSSKVIEEIHTLTYVPEGYELVKNEMLTGNRENEMVWINEDNSKIFFYQTVLVNKTTLDSENAENRILSNGLQIATIEKDSVIYVFWNDKQYAYTLIVQDIIKDEIIKIINSFD